jgi:hypothetical protein
MPFCFNENFFCSDDTDEEESASASGYGSYEMQGSYTATLSFKEKKVFNILKKIFILFFLLFSFS